MAVELWKSFPYRDGLHCQGKCIQKGKQAVRVATQYAPAPLLAVGAQTPRAPPSRRNVAVLCHAEYVRTLTAASALRVNAAVSKAAW